MVEGTVVVEEVDQPTLTYGTQNPQELTATLTIKEPYFYTRLLLHADLGFSEAFVLGEIVVDDLTVLLQILIRNSQQMNSLGVATASIGNILNWLQHNALANTVKNSLSNISAHYDIGNELFVRFLDESMMYSSGVYAQSDGQGDALNAAQMRKLEMIFTKANLCAEDNVLETGTGWGTFAIEAVKRYGCQVTSVTLSQ